MSSAATGPTMSAKPRPRLVTTSPTAVTTARTQAASMMMFGPDSSVPEVVVDSMPITAECNATAAKKSALAARALPSRSRRMP